MIGALLPIAVTSGLASKFRTREIAQLQVSSPEAWRRWERALQGTTWVKRVFLQYPDVQNSTVLDTEIVGQRKVPRHKYATSGYLKNYTAQIRALLPELGPEKIKAAAEEVLRRTESKPVFLFWHNCLLGRPDTSIRGRSRYE